MKLPAIQPKVPDYDDAYTAVDAAYYAAYVASAVDAAAWAEFIVERMGTIS